MVLEAPVVTVDASGVSIVPDDSEVSIAIPGPWVRPVVALGSPTYRLGESMLICDPAPGEGKGVEPAGPGPDPAKYAERPHPARGRVGTYGIPAPLIPSPSLGEA